MMTESELFDRLEALVRGVAKVDPSVAIGPQTHLVDDLGVDSLDLVGVFLQVQDDFGVAVAEDDLPGLQRMGDLARYLSARLPAVAA